MATTTATNAAAGFPLTTPNDGVLAVAYGTVEVATNPSPNDTVEFAWLPKGAVVVGGTFFADAMETDGTPTLAYKLGVPSDDDEFLTATVFAQNARESTIIFAGLNHPGFTPLASAEKVTLTWTAAATAFAAGTVTCAIYYVMPVNG